MALEHSFIISSFLSPRSRLVTSKREGSPGSCENGWGQAISGGLESELIWIGQREQMEDWNSDFEWEEGDADTKADARYGREAKEKRNSGDFNMV